MSKHHGTPKRSPVRLSRRGLIIAGGLAAAAGIMTPVANANVSNALKTYLLRSVPDLNMPDWELDAFLADFINYFDSENQRRGSTILMIAKYERAFYDGAFKALLPQVVTDALDRLESQLRRCFMLGTNFLDAGRLSGEPVRYEYIPDPYAVGCANRLATFDT